MGLLDDYLAALPEGIDSYRDCLVRASLYRQILDEHPCEQLKAAELAPALRALIDRPPPVSTMIPEVHHVAFVIAFIELEFETTTAFELYWFEKNQRLARKPLYAVLFRALGPRQFIKTSSRRNNHFRKGRVRLDILQLEKNQATAALVYPPHMYPLAAIETWAVAFRALISCTTKGLVTVDVTHRSDTETGFHIKWM